METKRLVETVLSACLLAGGLLRLLALLRAGKAQGRRFGGSAALMGFSAAAGLGVLLGCHALRRESQLLFCLLAISSLLLAYQGLLAVSRRRHALRRGPVLLFLVWLGAVLYVTMLSRDGSNDTSIFLFRWDLVSRALRGGSIQPLIHMLMNVLLFLPGGFLLPMTDREKPAGFLEMAAFALTLSALIEGVQLLLRLGQGDLTDVVCNTLGAALGYLPGRMAGRGARKASSAGGEGHG